MERDEQGFQVRIKARQPSRDDGTRGVKSAAKQAAGAVARATRPKSRRPAYRLTGSKCLVQQPSLRHQQVTVKTHIWYNKWRAPELQRLGRQRVVAHLRYIAREAAGPDNERPRFFGSRDVSEDTTRDFARDVATQPHMFRFIVSPEHGDALDLEAWTRDLMRQLGADLRTEPDWLAAVHTDTDSPHVHIELAGKDRRGRVLKIHEDYLFRGFRYRAQELATNELGFRRDRELAQALARSARAPLFTSLDRTLLSLRQDFLSGEVRLRDVRAHARKQRAYAAPQMERQLRERLAHLCELSLAKHVSSERWELHAELETRLRELGRRGDLLKALQYRDARRHAGQQVAIWDRREMVRRWIEGRVTHRQRADELTEREVLTVEAIDGKTYYIGLNETAEQLGRVRRGDLVRVSGGKNGHPNVYLQTRLTLEQQVQSVGRTWLDGKLVQQFSGRDLGDINPRAGMGADVAVQLEARKAVLRARGLLITDAFTERPVPDLLSKLYAAELAEFHHETRGRYGPGRRFTPDVAITGRLQVVDLPSGPHALLRERNGYRITPLRPQMMPFVGQEVALSLSLEAISRPLDRTTFIRVRAPGRDLGLSR